MCGYITSAHGHELSGYITSAHGHELSGYITSAHGHELSGRVRAHAYNYYALSECAWVAK